MISAKDICWSLRKKFSPPEFAICFECGDATGLETSRHLDAVVMNLYPSRGLSLTGYEIKISRGDLKEEISNPNKAHSIARYLDAFYLICPSELNILDIEVPLNWGIIFATENGLKTKRSAQPMQPEAIDRKFLGALLRGFGAEDQFRADKMIEEKAKFLDVEFATRVQRARDLQRSENDTKIQWADTVVNELQTAGFDWRNLRWHERDFVLAVKAALTYESIAIDGVEIACQMMENTARELRKQVTEIRGKSSKRDGIELDNSPE